jgi:hypothetical protein
VLTPHEQLEAISAELVAIFDIQHPPVPIEIMLQKPLADMWEEVDITELSVGFLKSGGHFSPRMSLARLLARHIVQSEWGAKRNLKAIIQQGDNDQMIRGFARMLIMPRAMVQALSSTAHTPPTMSIHFEVPEDDARLRLEEIQQST